MPWFKRIGFFLLILLALKGLIGFVGDHETGDNTIALADISGTIWTADETVEELRKLRKDEGVKGVVVRVNSPGGTVAASQEIHDALKLLKEKKPVVISMGTLAASGGLYLAMGADHIMANPGTITGSIGVLMEHVHVEDLLRRLGIASETVQSGKYKTMVSYDKPMSGEGRTLLQSMLGEVHDQFKQAIQMSRGLTVAEVLAFADGRIFTGAEAQKLRLVDRLGSFDAAVAWAAELAGIKEEPYLRKSEEGSFRWWRAFKATMSAFVSGPKICYLYK